MAARSWGRQLGPAATKQTSVTEVGLKGVTKEADGKRREVFLFTEGSGCQTVLMRFQTNGEEEQARNEDLKVFTAPRPGAAVCKEEQMAKAGLDKGP